MKASVASIVALLLSVSAFAQETPAPSPETAPSPTPPSVQTDAPPEPPSVMRGCEIWKHEGLAEGPLTLGYNEADWATGRRVCPRTEVGVGMRLNAIIDTPNFYGSVGVDGVLYGSKQLGKRMELFGTLEFINYSFVQNAVIKATHLTLGHATVGISRTLYGGDRFLGGMTARLILPTSFQIPNARITGVEVGNNMSWRPRPWAELHLYGGVDVRFALGNGPALPHAGFTVSGGVQLSPCSGFGLVVDLTGRLSHTSYFAPSFGLRFRIFRVHAELAATLPLAGSARNDVIGGLKVGYRF